MNTTFITESKVFLFCTLIGVISGIIFDFFRAIRYKKTVSLFEIIVEDVIFYLIITVISFKIILYINDAQLRVYMPLAAFGGFYFYQIIVGKKFFLTIVKVKSVVCGITKAIIKIIFSPIIKLVKILLKPVITIKDKVLRKKCKISLTINNFCFKIKCSVLKLFNDVKICKERKPCLKKQRPQKRI